MNLFNLWLALLGAFSLVQAMWRMPCPGTVARERIDPVIQPGQVSGHLHRVVGGSGVNFTMDTSLTQRARCSSCTVKQDKSNYIIPQLFIARNMKDGGARYELAPDGPVNIIYEQTRGDANEVVHPFPDGLTMTAGNPWRRNFTDDVMSHAVTFRCPGYDETHELPQNCPEVTATVHFPSCWDGHHNTADDFFSHMSYPLISFNQGNCPSSHPVRVVSLRYEFNFDTSEVMHGYGFTKPSLVFAQGDATGYGFHGVFINGWDSTALQKAIDTCTDTNTGDIASTCHALDQYMTSECEECKVPSRVDEPITEIDHLPGCNNITMTYSPPAGSLWPRDCTATDKISDFEVTYENLTGYGWAYEGCAHSYPPLGDFEWESEQMTPHDCVYHCDYTVLQNATTGWASVSGNVCRCSIDSSGAAPVPGVLGQCDKPCPGEKKDLICGGDNHASLYRKCSHDQDSCTDTPFQEFPVITKRSANNNTATIPNDIWNPVSIRSEGPMENSVPWIGYKVCKRISGNITDGYVTLEQLSCHVFSGYDAEMVADMFRDWARKHYHVHNLDVLSTTLDDVVNERLAKHLIDVVEDRALFFRFNTMFSCVIVLMSIICGIGAFIVSYVAGKGVVMKQKAVNAGKDVEVIRRLLNMDPQLRTLLYDHVIREHGSRQNSRQEMCERREAEAARPTI